MLTTLGARSFSAAAPKLWNGLPMELRQATSLDSFKSRLKTYLSIFYSLYLSLFYSHGNVFFVFSLIYDCKALLIGICRYALHKLVNY